MPHLAPTKPTILPLHVAGAVGATATPGSPAGKNPLNAAPPNLRRKITKRELRRLDEVKQAVAQIERLPDLDEAVHAILDGRFNAWDIVPAIVKLSEPGIVSDLAIATLGYSMKNARELFALIDAGKIAATTFLCSHYFAKASSKEFEFLRSGMTERGHTVRAARSHAKVIAAKLTDGRCVVVEMSSNLRSCKNYEQICMTQSPELFAWHKKWISEIASA